MCKFNPKNDSRWIDPCMILSIKSLGEMGFKVVACCCGHKRYSMTIVVKGKNGFFELLSNINLPGKKKFYVKDIDGYYFIPEVEDKLMEQETKEAHYKNNQKAIRKITRKIK